MSCCNWGHSTALNQTYHDQEWGIPVHDDKKQFEYLMMEALQCGLSWSIVLNKREVFRRCFNNFDYDQVAQYKAEDVARIMATDGMIKSRRKMVHSVITFGTILKAKPSSMISIVRAIFL